MCVIDLMQTGSANWWESQTVVMWNKFVLEFIHILMLDPDSSLFCNQDLNKLESTLHLHVVMKT